MPSLSRGLVTARTVRAATWDGTTSAGADAPAGAYTWTFTAEARDGDGSVTNLDGASAIFIAQESTYMWSRAISGYSAARPVTT